jgi:3-dehydroquinate synthase
MTLNYIFESECRPLKSEVIIENDSIARLYELGLLNDVRKESVHLLITDNNVEKLHLQTALSSMERIGLQVRTLVVPANEASKSFEWYAKLVQQGLNYGFDKQSYIFSLGGGVVNNLAGFLASTLYRGIGLIHFPTSLLSQVDASIDFKQAINFEHGKNLIGSFYAASKIIVDPLMLQTLEPRLVRDGLAESIKHALCQDTGFLSYMSANSSHLTAQDFLSKVVKWSIELKLELMQGAFDCEYDESIKHYGHAVGHAIEFLSHGELYHGESISIGMCVSAEIGYLLNLTDRETLDAHYDIFEKIGLPTTVPNGFSLLDIWEKIRYDKHFRDDLACMGLLRTSGVMAKPLSGDFWHYIEKDVIFKAIETNRERGERFVG